MSCLLFFPLFLFPCAADYLAISMRIGMSKIKVNPCVRDTFFVCYGIFKSTEEINECFGFYTFFLVFDDFGNGSKQLKSAKRVETCNLKASSSMDRKEL